MTTLELAKLGLASCHGEGRPFMNSWRGRRVEGVENGVVWQLAFEAPTVNSALVTKHNRHELCPRMGFELGHGVTHVRTDRLG